ncbi:HNH endonuclease [Corynebacterium sp. ES2775-CONJ]|uniref:HNH endonuclease n=1 Tax=Corynebacterium sp. ES2775-CONJ TaxID=2974029 RepID=UPI00216A7579|nr:HNH endonuclease signature motif containing protein [Corynebacterium sp. ES2775-CONJ]MCS4490004.1 HNH endonuclease [Corynebacterium sp. ES2775-CONJ]
MKTCLESIKDLAPRGGELAYELKRTVLTKDEMALFLDCTHTEASLMLAVAKTFHPDELDLAIDYQLSFAKLRLISSVSKKLRNPSIDPKELREELIRQAATLSCFDLDRHIKTTLKTLNAEYSRPRAWYARFSATADADGMRYINMKLPEAQCERLRTVLTPQAHDKASQGMANGEAEGLAMALYETVITNTSTDSGHRDLRHSPLILIPIADAQEHCDGTVTNSDGVILNITDIAEEIINEMGFAIAIYKDSHGVPRPHEVLDIKRLADADDRFRAITSHLICQHPECSIPAVRCDIHHIQAFSRGGATTTANLCPLCRVHNLRNDDDPNRSRHGRVEADPKTGLISYRMPDGTQRANLHPAISKGTQAFAHRILGEC